VIRSPKYPVPIRNSKNQQFAGYRVDAREMQKILRRVATAERVATKRQKAKDLKSYKNEKWERKGQFLQQLSAVRGELRDTKKALKDDWALGPLAPRHDVAEWHGAFGAIGEFRYSSPGKLNLAARNARCQWAGGAHHLCLAVGDRVVLLDGPDKGRIGEIADIDEDSAELTVEGLNKVGSSHYVSQR
jgi:large subunit ribosomal protein L24